LPLYEYKCDKCGHRFEKIEKHSASEMKKCPKCGAHAPRQLSAPGIQFKGSGWYVTDYGGKSSSASSGEGSGDSSASKSEKSEKSEKSQKSDSKSTDSKSSDSKSSTKKDKK
jgi:putative FmdB family regulatory protein